MLDSLTLDQMRMLTAVADEGSFSAAARRLGRVQSAVSQGIQAMETSLGLTLFDRSQRTPALTESGQAIVADFGGRGEELRVRVLASREGWREPPSLERLLLRPPRRERPRPPREERSGLSVV